MRFSAVSDSGDLARRILAYLDEHPQSQDTLEGVAHWWLLQQRIDESLDEVQAALDELTKSGLVVSDGRGGANVYRLNTKKVNEIRNRLADS